MSFVQGKDYFVYLQKESSYGVFHNSGVDGGTVFHSLSWCMCKDMKSMRNSIRRAAHKHTAFDRSTNNHAGSCLYQLIDTVGPVLTLWLLKRLGQIQELGRYKH